MVVAEVVQSKRSIGQAPERKRQETITARRRRIVRAAIPDSPSTRRTTRPSPPPRRWTAMNANTSAGVTAAGALSTTANNTRKSDTRPSTRTPRQRRSITEISTELDFTRLAALSTRLG